MHATVAVLPGDGIGSEVIGCAVQVLRVVASHGGHTLEFKEALIGGVAIDAVGHPLPESTLALCRILMQFFSVLWEDQSGIIPRLAFGRNRGSWHCAKGWTSSPICVL